MPRLKWLIPISLCGLLALGGLWIRHLVSRPGALGRILSAALEETFHARPSVTIRKYVVVEEKKPIAELALVSRQTDVERRIETVRLKSKAELSLRAVFNVKAGFDLRAARFSLDLDPDLKHAALELPRPKVLSMEMVSYEVLADRSGWWNRISEAERELAMRDMLADAKLEAIRAGILKDCRQRMDEELAGISKRTGVAIRVRYRMSGNSGSGGSGDGGNVGEAVDSVGFVTEPAAGR
ncbi:MAG: DUF4230 domain-containing protein [Fibrobacteria bacterium]